MKTSSNWFIRSIRTFHERHEGLKNAVHNGMRYPLPKWGRIAMGAVYFTIPVVGGYQIMQWAIRKSHDEIGEHGERLPVKEMQGLGDKRRIISPTAAATSSTNDGGEREIKLQRVGAGGWGGGVHLTVSDAETQKRNNEKFKRMLNKIRRGEDDTGK